MGVRADGQTADGTAPTGVPLANVLANLAAELEVAESICVSVEAIINDRMKSCDTGNDLVRIELQNMDRLIQMLRDFRTLLTYLGTSRDGALVDAVDCGRHLIMDELRRRLLTQETFEGVREASVLPSEVTFF